MLVVFCDGVTEALNADGVEFGEERLLAFVSANNRLTPTTLLERLLEHVRGFSAGSTQSDDLTALVLQYIGPFAAQPAFAVGG
jgi:phosphoserine phosphatase RsbU/P